MIFFELSFVVTILVFITVAIIVGNLFYGSILLWSTLNVPYSPKSSEIRLI